MTTVYVPSPSISRLEAYCGAGSLYCEPADSVPAIGATVEIAYEKTGKVIATGQVIAHRGARGAFLVDNFQPVTP